jgi:hypothetical protein
MCGKTESMNGHAQLFKLMIYKIPTSKSDCYAHNSQGHTTKSKHYGKLTWHWARA